jgi:periplasmic divalent cation tolerance protein
MTDFIFVYIPCSSASEAEAIATHLVEERLAACANILSPMQSIYRWQGTIERTAEVAVIAKTQALLFDKLTARVRALHSYDQPCIVALPITAGDRDFLDWVKAQTD